MSKTRIGVLISGRGSNMQALIETAQTNDYPGEVVLVISNKADAGGLAVAGAAGIPTAVIDHRPFGANRGAHERAIDTALRASGVEIVALAGYLRVISPWLVEAWAGRMVNIHPSLLPDFPGLHTHARALEAGVKVHGCTVHLVTSGVDEGPILGQTRVEVRSDDNEQSLGARVLLEEHQLFPRCIAELIRGRVTKTAP